ncbi:Dystonin,Spectrin beta chain, non-erythrocytic 1,Spectrin beta chain, non-erythrocytic 2,Plectin,Microtubule-actin cross-linking factor 1,Microtubule-actin cross-linking factor 1, isoforms 1/2/3/5,Spectrin beta chain [Lepeophtheirus salmonis]|uniref:Calponin-homology (CH) domain-containing protein n=1 Tax=Lepeophtheirus salmonis TaxID=72036 RepID=A0A7R8D533_LEPSM|nr:Dystonin,Spectrin beta chain, non-erythrocytic 1,Spectrin beta chain, non-erythrocytic 2,Plectin,Microtubule-actin cross-linking factor 1,Microtubule-actin cross-linking factor 1, isoforms 1/2/3/5,Spectrin beta chain [Lepeophtheirus salmonis]CAF3026800.1 Dystonin,Spectrin beta chain, non-erythrocytic 1,Spectrin beta chain, non-erythrocytic 2,Plectin,Microtubule-actin cross-linking factor 1,Microtubule-actin cross-linking factor 1, isoforms 1/2/3/5,Spectrin beta chain [Lepeophtheirus salmonis]
MSSGTRKDEKVQKKTFGKWINAQLAGRGIVITDLYYDLRDGHVLLELLGVLTNRSFVKEKGKLRVHHLGNAYTILSILKVRNKVKLVNINNVDLVDGNPKITLALVWSIIVHWQFRDVMKESIVKGSSGLEKILLAWTCSATQKHYPDSVKDFGDSWRNGLAFGALLAHFRPDLVVWDNYLRIQNHTDRLDFIFNTIRDHLGIQKLLDPEDFLSTPDKKSLMMYIMCLYDVLPHDIVPLERGQSLNSDSECSLFGSPFKTPVKVTEEGLKYEVYCPLHEDMVQWLLDAEEKLNSMRKVHGDLPEIKQLFEEYKEYMEELNYNQEAVGEVLELGSKLIDDPNLNTVSRKGCSSSSEEKMKELRGWMTLTEDRISRMGSIGINLEDIDKQMREHSVLQKDLESQQTIVNSISNFIIADIGEGKSEGHVSSSNSNEQELEDQVTALGERWIHLCVWIEDRWSALKDASKLWSSFSTEKEVLNIWLDNSMSTLKQVERSPTEDMKELMIQLRLIAAIFLCSVSKLTKYKSRVFEFGMRVSHGSCGAERPMLSFPNV